MKKVILTENQIKRMMDKLIVSEQETKSISTENQFYTINSYNFLTKNDGGSIKLYSCASLPSSLLSWKYLNIKFLVNDSSLPAKISAVI